MILRDKMVGECSKNGIDEKHKGLYINLVGGLNFEELCLGESIELSVTWSSAVDDTCTHGAVDV
jgi:hypothetical protein